FGGRFDHEYADETQLDGSQTEFDELLILVAIADDHAAGLFQRGERDDDLGLAAYFEAVLEAFAERSDLFDHLRLLVHLDGINATIFVFVAQVFDGATERGVQAMDLCVENVLDAQQDRHLQVTLEHAIDDVHELDLSI